MSNERLSREQTGVHRKGRKKKKTPQGRRYQDRSYSTYESCGAGEKKKKRRGPMLKGRALYDKWDWIANKILAQ